MKKHTSILIACLFYSFLSIGQRVIAPLEYNPEQAAHHAKASLYRTSAIGDTLSLPFFDDFTQSTVVPDVNNWETNGGTFINNNYPINPPNFNVATFDGIAENGIPYNTVNIFLKGPTDRLTSRPIDLSVLSSIDSVYLRFYWQGQGIGEVPDANEDSIQLLIKNRSGAWKRVWSAKGNSTVFNHSIIRIGDSTQYFYKGFQFKFQAYGKQSGNYDLWNVDYIHLDTGRLAKDNWFPDLSFSTTPTSFLKNYTAMPIKQYMHKKTEETATSVDVKLVTRNNKEFVYRIFENYNILQDIKNNNVELDKLLDTTGAILPLEIVDIKWKPNPSVINTNSEKILKYTFVIGDELGLDPHIDSLYDYTSDTDKEKSRIDFTKNDSVSGYTYLTDYYSYDDGSAEYGIGINQAQGKVAVKYSLNLPDTLTHIEIYFPRIGLDRSSESINLSVWSSINVGGTGQNLLYAETVLLEHPTALNKFHIYELENPVIINSSTFYVGYQQSSDVSIFTGLDKNIDNRNKIFYNINDTWTQESDEAGSLMIRPVFGSNRIIAGIKNPSKKYNELECEVYPNPSDGNIYIAGKISTLNIFDLSGKLLLSKTYNGMSEDIKYEDLSLLSNGFYFLHLENGDARTVKKIVVSR